MEGRRTEKTLIVTAENRNVSAFVGGGIKQVPASCQCSCLGSRFALVGEKKYQSNRSKSLEVALRWMCLLPAVNHSISRDVHISVQKPCKLEELQWGLAQIAWFLGDHSWFHCSPAIFPPGLQLPCSAPHTAQHLPDVLSKSWSFSWASRREARWKNHSLIKQ